MIKTPLMLLLREDDAYNHELIKKQVRDIAEAGFDAVCLEFRESYCDEFDKDGQQAMRIVYDAAKENGLGFVKIMPYDQVKILDKYPYLKRKLVKEYCINIGDKARTITLDMVRNTKANNVIAAFRIDRDDTGKIVKADNVLRDVTWQISEDYLTVKAIDSGEYLIYTDYVINIPDYAHEDSELILKEFLNVYDEYELDGFALDEFGTGSMRERFYLSNESFLNKFQEKCGYDFMDNIYLMNHLDQAGTFAKIRFDYYNCIEDVTYEYQMKAKQLFTERYGKDIFIGFHHNWWGEGNSGDLWRGNIDYFRLADTLSGGFIDAQYDSERTMTSMTLLAESLAKYSTGHAYNMCWDRFCTPEKMDYFHRFLAVRNVNWVGHALMSNPAYRKGTCPGSFIQTLKNNEYWGDVNKCISREKQFSEFIGKAQSRAKIAILYIWESNAYFNNDYMHLHRGSLKAMADKFVLSNIPVDIVPSYETNFDDYEVIFVLWPAMMPKELWESLKEQAKIGKKICFIGSPAYVTTDGTSILDEFEELVGVHIDRTAPYNSGYEYRAMDFWFTDKVIRPIKYMDAHQKTDFVNGNIYYYGYELPLTDLFYNVVHKDLAEYKIVDSDKVISKIFYDENSTILTTTARWQRKINETFELEGNTICIKQGVLVGIKLEDGKVKEIISEPGAEIFVNGELAEYKVY